ncbi:Curlin associated repeat protein [Sulfitobacter noctilucicola]|uniref:Curlin associated repeat-containing protein n=1 Tax=Sulfitobacter noctilucicola TaxID=1342301 RepID=A0A7W6MAN0_9RHOB|nr:hypothetical protein [Sulfitobacter noctilucicola]KIN63400.1 Curlin associated repeat protein [Sulfitobacter noctilucicola]MBB4175083.1 hypothetical protein [Sulfitobacter noctilucicola]
MKNLLITTALSVGFASAAFANDSDIDQIGLGNNAVVTQSGGTGSSSTVLQNGDNDLATVLQSDGAGTDTNISSIQQLGGSGTQTANVKQNNAANGPTNNAQVIQDSTQGGNFAGIDQDGDGNSALAQQGPGDAVNCGLFGCSSTSPLDITNSVASLQQVGTGNTATTLQVVGSNGGDNNVAGTMQDGIGNTASIRQGTGAVNSVWFVPNPASNDNDNLAQIDQTGDGNTSAIEQGGESGTANNMQVGMDNDSTIVQSGGLPGLGNNALVTQNGDRNTSLVAQTSANGDLPALPSGTRAVVTQNADDSESTIIQKPLGGHLAVLTQNGADHYSMIEQDGLLNTAEVTQSLTGQESTIFQTGPSVVGPVGNVALVTQTMTSGNGSLITQSGIGNLSTVMQ